MYVTTQEVANERYVLIITRACCPPGPRKELLKLGHNAHKMHVPVRKFVTTQNHSGLSTSTQTLYAEACKVSIYSSQGI